MIFFPSGIIVDFEKNCNSLWHLEFVHRVMSSCFLFSFGRGNRMQFITHPICSCGGCVGLVYRCRYRLSESISKVIEYTCLVAPSVDKRWNQKKKNTDSTSEIVDPNKIGIKADSRQGAADSPSIRRIEFLCQGHLTDGMPLISNG